MKKTESNSIGGILLEDPVVVDTMPPEDPVGFDGAAAFLAVILPPLITVAASWVIQNDAVVVWVISVLVGARCMVRRMSANQGLVVAATYLVLMSIETLYIVIAVPNGFYFSDSM